MKKKIAVLLISFLALTACSTSTEGNKVDMKDINEYTADDDGDKEDDLDFAAEGEVAPDIAITKLDGTEGSVSDYFGKPTIILFWATWCGYCVSEMPGVQMLADKYGDKINILALNAGDDAETIEDFMDEEGYTFEAAQVSIENSIYYGAQSIPVTVIMDFEGVIQSYLKGSLEGEEMFNQYFDPIFSELTGETDS